MEIPAGTALGNYVVESKLGSGGFATVYKASSAGAPQNVVAIKACPNQGGAAQLFKDEIAILQFVNKSDPHGYCDCIRLLDHFQDASGTFTCMVFPLLGLSVFSFLHSNKQLPFPRKHVQKLGRELLNALAFIHSLGIVHCDLKSDNVLLRDNNHFEVPYEEKNPRPLLMFGRSQTPQTTPKRMRKILIRPHLYLCDFGLARLINGRKQTDVSAVGPFLTPETCLKIPWDYSVDIYAAGLVMYEMILGSGIIPPRCPPAKTLTLLHSFFGPLPNNLAKQAASKATEVPFTKVNRTIINASMFETTELDFNKMKVSSRDLQASMVMHEFKNLRVTSEKGGGAFIDLMDKMLRYDPNKRITASQALKDRYFSMEFPEPVPPQMHSTYRRPPKRA